ncbi:M24 family metallopeptidase [Pseudoalteromonas sp. MMG013]|nr:M24 family metallopeptidase [Pseudoalteromonas sp. MMG013]
MHQNNKNHTQLLSALLSFAFLLYSFLSHAETELADMILPMKARAQWIDNNTQERVKALLPQLMKDTNIDMWVLISREYNEDPVLKTLLPATWLSARRTTVLLFARNKHGQVDALAIAPYNVGDVFQRAWNKSEQPDQWKALAEVIEKYKPNSIALNTSEHWAHADGLVVTDKDQLVAHLPKGYQKKLVSAEPLAVAWLEQRTKNEIFQYGQIVKIAHAIIEEGFSSKVIKVGETTTDDLTWWYRERVRELKLTTWFHPSVSIQRAGVEVFDHEASFTNANGENVIQPGDLLHLDFGITYLRLNTDTQQHAYVLKKGELQAPDYLQNALAKGNLLQDILTEQFVVGRTGNMILKRAREFAIAQKLKPTIYTHPIGFHGHGAGTTIGMWDAQQGVVGDGDYPLHLNTAYSIELNNAVYLPQWNKEIRIMLEEDAIFTREGVQYLNGRQTQLFLVESASK